MNCVEQASALALAVYGRELRQMDQPVSTRELSETLCSHLLPHQNRSNLKNRCSELAAQFQSVLALGNAVGIHSQEEKQRIANGWLQLAVSFAKIPVYYEAGELKRHQKQEAVILQEMG